jgi:glutathione peroxidase-family protein
MSEFRGKVVLVVNTATKCGLADQFKGLEELHQKCKEEGFIVIGFPSDQFKQEPETNETMVEACLINFGVTFPISEKISERQRYPSSLRVSEKRVARRGFWKQHKVEFYSGIL